MATSPTPDAKAHSLLRLTLTGLLSGIISALIAATMMLALSNYQFYGSPHVGQVAGSAAQNFAEDLPTALMAAFLWYIPIGTFIFPPLAKLIGASTGNGLVRLLRFAVLGALTWFLAAWVIYLVLSPLAPAPPGVQRNDLITAALSGVLFAVVYDLLLLRRDYLLGQRRR